MFAKIIPLTKLPRRFDEFDYSVPEELENKIKPGHLVVVYFRKRKIHGVITRVTEKVSIENKNIKKIESLTDIILPGSLLKLFSWASNYYLSSPAIFYNSFIPQIVKARVKERNLTKEPLSFSKDESRELYSALQKIEKNNLFFLFDKSLKQTLGVFIKLAQKALLENEQALFLVPSIQDISLFAPYLNNVFGDRLLLWHSKLSQGEKFTLWQKILNKHPLVVLGTRPSVFLPFRKLSFSFIYNSSSEDHKQWDQNPRYDAKKVLSEYSANFGTKIIFSDILPELAIYKKIKEELIILLNNPPAKNNFSLVDIRKEKNPASPLFSFPLYEMIKEAKEKNKQVILFLNRREKDSLMICGDCNYIFKCPECKNPFSIDNNSFLCYHCNIKKEIETACPKCKNTRLKPLRIGIENFKKILEKEFAGIKIQTMTKCDAVESFHSDILITTDYFWKNILPKIDMKMVYAVALLDFDFYLIRPEFNQQEGAAMALYRFLQLSKEADVRALIQTTNLENILFSNWENMYDNELNERKEMSYPPYFRLIKIICKGENSDELELNAKNLYNELLKKEFNASAPFAPFHKKRTKNYLMHIILKESLDKNLSALKNIIPDKYQIDVDPISIY
ncbi:hypothetical protein KKB41_03980 [Patescibacteria group bacterium]|nr:hypothetical protein [Patescibacteria group bacterium]